MTQSKMAGRSFKQRLIMLVVIVLTLCGTGVKSASADVPPGTVAWVQTRIITLPGTGQDGRELFYDAVDAIRRLAGHPTGFEVLRETQNYTGGLIGLNIQNALGLRVGTLFINPHSLYIVGFRAGNYVYFFQDANPRAISELERYAADARLSAVVLRMNGSYVAWTNAVTSAGRTIQHNFDASDYLAAAARLEATPNPQNVGAFHANIAEDMLTLSSAYELSVRMPAYRDNVGAAMALSVDGSEAAVYTALTEELRVGNSIAIQFTSGGGLDFEGSTLSTRLARDLYLGPLNGTLRTYGDLNRTFRIVVGETTR